MTVHFRCDICGEPFDAGEGATLEIHRAHKFTRRFDYHDHPDAQCVERVLRQLGDLRDHGRLREDDPDHFGLEWRLVGKQAGDSAVCPSDLPIDVLKVDFNTYCAITQAGVRYVHDLARKTDDELLEIAGVGPVRLAAIRKAVAQAIVRASREDG